MTMLQSLAGGFSPNRVGAMVTRYLYLLRSSWPRVADLIYWPTVQMITWGFIQTYVSHGAGAGGAPDKATIAAGTLIGAMLLWDMLFGASSAFPPPFSRKCGPTTSATS